MSDLATMLLSTGAVKFGEFVLTSGRKSSFYVDVKKALTKPEILETIAREMSDYVVEDLIAGMELGAVPIAAAVSLRSMKPYLILRKGKREHGTGKRIEGDYSSARTVIIVEDVATTGGSIIRSAEILRAEGLKVDRALVVVDREEGASASLQEIGIELIPLVRIGDIKPKDL